MLIIALAFAVSVFVMYTLPNLQAGAGAWSLGATIVAFLVGLIIGGFLFPPKRKD